MSRLRIRMGYGEVALLLRIVCAVAALAALALLTPADWRGHFRRVPAAGGLGAGQ